MTDIVGYTFNAEILCPACTLNAVSENSTTATKFKESPMNWSNHGFVESVESWLRTKALERGIDYDDESSYDSGDFPKVILRFTVEDDERCGHCNEHLVF
jgi:hypothetical protein